jgi:hypothetical protein
MALVVKDRVKETTTTTGTGSISLGGAVTKFKTFSSALSNADTTYYAIEQQGNTNEFEIGIGTYTSSGNTLARTTILASSNSNNAVDLSAGTKNIFITYPADKAVFEDASGNISIPGTIDGRDLATDGTKLDGIEASATADQTNAEIRAAVEAATDSNVFTDADHTKLNGIEASATADQTNAEIRAAVEAASDSNVFTDDDHTKLNGIEASATADQTDAEIRAAVEAASDSNVFTDADHTKLNGIEASADVTDTANVTSAGALMDSEVTNLAQVKAFDSSDYATAAQGSTADAAMPKSGGTFTDDVSFGDNDKAIFGAGSDLQIYHNGSDSYVDDTGTGALILRGNSNVTIGKYTGETMGYFEADGAAYLYHNNAIKFQTSATGVDVTGNITVSGTVDGKDVSTLTTAAAAADEATALAIALG